MKWKFSIKKLNILLITIKKIANSIYGFTGAGNGYFPFLPAARSITSIGRNSILKAKEYMETQGVNVIYGDTDSVLCRIMNKEKIKLNPDGTYDVKEMFSICKELECNINKLFQKPMRMEFEGELYRYVLFTAKKHYIAILLDNKGRINDKPKYKGVMAVRRDVCKYAKDLFTKITNIATNQNYELKCKSEKCDYCYEKRNNKWIKRKIQNEDEYKYYDIIDSYINEIKNLMYGLVDDDDLSRDDFLGSWWGSLYDLEKKEYKRLNFDNVKIFDLSVKAIGVINK